MRFGEPLQRLVSSVLFGLVSASGLAAQADDRPTMAEGDTAPVQTEIPRRFDDQGFSAAVGFGPVFCLTPDECNSLRELDLGLGLGALIGYRFAPWVRMDLGGAFTYRLTADSVDYDYHLYWFALDAGMTVFPLRSRYEFDLVLGLHTGYVRSVARSSSSGSETGPDHGYAVISELSYSEGVDLVESVGLVVHVSEHLAVGLVYNAHYFLFFHHCVYWGSAEVAVDDGCEYEDVSQGWAHHLALTLEVTF